MAEGKKLETTLSFGALQQGLTQIKRTMSEIEGDLKKALSAPDKMVNQTIKSLEKINKIYELQKSKLDSLFQAMGKSDFAVDFKSTKKGIDDLTKSMKEMGFTQKEIGAISRALGKDQDYKTQSQKELTKAFLKNNGLRIDKEKETQKELTKAFLKGNGLRIDKEKDNQRELTKAFLKNNGLRIDKEKETQKELTKAFLKGNGLRIDKEKDNQRELTKAFLKNNGLRIDKEKETQKELTKAFLKGNGLRIDKEKDNQRELTKAFLKGNGLRIDKEKDNQKELTKAFLKGNKARYKEIDAIDAKIDSLKKLNKYYKSDAGQAKLKELKKLKEANEKLTKSQDSVNKSTKKSVLSLGHLANSAKIIARNFLIYKSMSAIFKGLASELKNIVDVGMSFEAQMQRNKAITKPSIAAFGEMNEIVRHLGATTEFTATQAAEGMQFLSQQGLSVNQTMKALPSTLDFATVAQISLAESAEKTTNIMKALGLEIEDLGRINDVLTVTSTNTATGVSQLAGGFTMVASTARLMNTSLEETSAYLGVLADAGLKGTKGGRALDNALRRLPKAFDKIGVAYEGQGLSQFLAYLGDKVKGPEAVKVLNELFGAIGTRAAGNILASSEKLEKLILQLKNAEGATKDFVETIRDSAAIELKALQSAIEEVRLDIWSEYGDEFRAVITELTEWVREHRDQIVKLATVLGGLFYKAFKGALFIVEKFVEIFGRFGYTITSLVAGGLILKLAGSIKIAGIAMKTSAGYASLLSVSLRAMSFAGAIFAIYELYKAFESYQKKIQEAIEKTKEMSSKLVDLRENYIKVKKVFGSGDTSDDVKTRIESIDQLIKANENYVKAEKERINGGGISPREVDAAKEKLKQYGYERVRLLWERYGLEKRFEYLRDKEEEDQRKSIERIKSYKKALSSARAEMNKFLDELNTFSSIDLAEGSSGSAMIDEKDLDKMKKYFEEIAKTEEAVRRDKEKNDFDALKFEMDMLSMRRSKMKEFYNQDLAAAMKVAEEKKQAILDYGGTEQSAIQAQAAMIKKWFNSVKGLKEYLHSIGVYTIDIKIADLEKKSNDSAESFNYLKETLSGNIIGVVVHAILGTANDPEWDKALSIMGANINEAWERFVGLFNSASSSIGTGWNSALDSMKVETDGIIDYSDKLLHDAAQGVNKLWLSFASLFDYKKVDGKLGNYLDDLGDWFVKTWNKFMDILKVDKEDPTGDAINSANKLTSSGSGSGSDNEKGSLDAVKGNVWVDIIKAILEIPNIIRGIFDKVGKLLPGIADMLKDLPQMIESLLVNVMYGISEIFSTLFDDAWWQELYESLVRAIEYFLKMLYALIFGGTTMVPVDDEEAKEKIEDMNSAINSLKDTLFDIYSAEYSLALGPEELKRQEAMYNETLARAQNGDTDAIELLSEISTEYLKNAQNLYKSSDDYMDLYAKVRGDLEGVVNANPYQDTEDLPQQYEEKQYDGLFAQLYDAIMSLLDGLMEIFGDFFTDFYHNISSFFEDLLKTFASFLGDMIKDIFSQIGIDINWWREGGAVPKYAKGGMLNGPSHEKGGIPARVGKRAIELEGGEYVINKKTSDLLGTDLLGMINSVSNQDDLSKVINILSDDKFADGGSVTKFADGGTTNFKLGSGGDTPEIFAGVEFIRTLVGWITKTVKDIVGSFLNPKTIWKKITEPIYEMLASGIDVIVKLVGDVVDNPVTRQISDFIEKYVMGNQGMFSSQLQYAQGGIASGPATGYPVTLHGTEAVVPLSGGRSIPVEINNSENIKVSKEMLEVMKTLVDITKANKPSNKPIVVQVDANGQETEKKISEGSRRGIIALG